MTSVLKPFFNFYGSKWRLAPKYPVPDVIWPLVEPFAGSAGYALRHYKRSVILVEKDARIATLWDFLIRASPDDIRDIPLVDVDGSLSDTHLLPMSGPWLLVAFNMGPTTVPRKSFAPGARRLIKGETKDGLRRLTNFWGAKRRERIAEQVAHIKHWMIINGDYQLAPNIHATWFVDPPYTGGIGAGKCYRYGVKDIDYDALGLWCRHRQGRVIVCEAVGANWLPFTPFAMAKSLPCGRGTSPEAVWTQG